MRIIKEFSEFNTNTKWHVKMSSHAKTHGLSNEQINSVLNSNTDPINVEFHKEFNSSTSKKYKDSQVDWQMSKKAELDELFNNNLSIDMGDNDNVNVNIEYDVEFPNDWDKGDVIGWCEGFGKIREQNYSYLTRRMYIGSKFANKKSATPDSKERLTKMLDTLDDMFLDCKDDGFKLDYGGNLLNIEITKPVNRGHNMYSNNWFKMSEISDTLHMIMSYLDTFSDMIELESIEINVRKPLGIQGPMIISKPIKREDIDKDIDLSNIHITYKELGI